MSNVRVNEFIFLCPKTDVARVRESLVLGIVEEDIYLITSVREDGCNELITVEGIETSLSYYDWKII